MPVVVGDITPNVRSTAEDDASGEEETNAEEVVITLMADPQSVESSFSEDTSTWTSDEPVTFSWTVDPMPEEDITAMLESSNDGGLTWMEVVSFSVSAGSVDTTITGLGCSWYRVTAGELASDPIEVCTMDPAYEFTFPDVPNEPEAYTFYDQIMTLSNDGIVNGYEDGYFRPMFPLTRAHMAKFVRRTFFGYSADTSCEAFPDVGTDNPFYTEITTLKCKGIVGGFEDGTYKPDQNVTRGEAMKFVVEAMRSATGDENYLAYTGSEEPFSDVPTDYTFYEVIMAAQTNGIVSGYEDETFLPGSFTTRGAMSKMVANARDNLPNIVETAVANGSFTTLVQALQDTGLDSALSGPGPFTVFGPTDDAFDALPPGTIAGLTNEQLTEVLQYHVLNGRVNSRDAVAAGEAETLFTGNNVTITEDGGTIVINAGDDDATVIMKDVQTSNGVIHVIDAVLLP
jgi:uncharacterized surface protein with fasciclin (FAS1) repeats